MNVQKQSVQRILQHLFLVVAAVTALFGWLAGSPHGSSPDDNYHLTSIWCARGFVDDKCESNEQGYATVPASVALADCFKANPLQTASCQHEQFTWNESELVEQSHSNVDRSRPNLYYRIMHLFVSDNPLWSIVAMRLANIALAVAMFGGVYWISRPGARQALAASWLIASVPLGAFLLASTNTSAWGIVGVGTFWAALLAALEGQTVRARLIAGSLAALAAAIAVGARAETAAFLAVSVVCVALFHTRADLTSVVRFRRSWGAGAGLIAVALAVLWAYRGRITFLGALVDDGFSSLFTVGNHAYGNALFYNMVQLPSFWAGISGYRIGDRGALGWFDTTMPAVVYIFMIAAVSVVIFAGIAAMSRSKAITLGIIVATLTAGPLALFTATGRIIPHDIQPRHFMGLFYLLIAFAILTERGQRPIRLQPVQRLTIIALTSIANAIALHVNIRRYTTGQANVWIFNLNDNVDWWWNTLPSPMVIWSLASIAFAVIATAAMSQFAAEFPAARELASESP